MRPLQHIRNYKNNLHHNWWFHLVVRSAIRKIAKDNIIVLEIGTGDGSSSTKAFYKELKNTGKKFLLISYEPSRSVYEKALSVWKGVYGVLVQNSFFITPAAVAFYRRVMLQEVLPPAMVKNVLTQAGADPRNMVSAFVHQPDIIFIDSIRYSHLAIVTSIVDPGLHNNAMIIMEDDIPHPGESAILSKYFRLEQVKKHSCYPHQWPFLSFRITGQKTD